MRIVFFLFTPASCLEPISSVTPFFFFFWSTVFKKKKKPTTLNGNNQIFDLLFWLSLSFQNRYIYLPDYYVKYTLNGNLYCTFIILHNTGLLCDKTVLQKHMKHLKSLILSKMTIKILVFPFNLLLMLYIYIIYLEFRIIKAQLYTFILAFSCKIISQTLNSSPCL